jgi:hypothetical protein
MFRYLSLVERLYNDKDARIEVRNMHKKRLNPYESSLKYLLFYVLTCQTSIFRHSKSTTVTILKVTAASLQDPYHLQF